MTKLLCPAFVALLAVASTSLAQNQNPRPRSDRAAPRRPDAAQIFQRFDNNEDGFLEEDEVPAQMKRRFQQLDANKDGKISKDELQNARPGSRPGDAPAGEVNTPPAKGERIADTLKVGVAAPDFTLSDPTGKRDVTLSDFRGKKPVVLIFGSYT